jgi:hypothetical protein
VVEEESYLRRVDASSTATRRQRMDLGSGGRVRAWGREAAVLGGGGVLLLLVRRRCLGEAASSSS